MSKVIVMLGGGIEAVPIIERAQAMGLRVVVVDGNPHALGMDMVNLSIEESCYSADDAITGLDAMQSMTDVKYHGVFCAATDASHVAAAVAAHFGLPGLSVEAAALGVDKLAQNHTLSDAGLPVPLTFSTDFHGPLGIGDWVIKPTGSRGGRGVSRVHIDTGQQSEEAQVAYTRAREYSDTVIAQRWLDGLQLSTESIVQDGRVLFTAVALRNYDRLDEYKPYVVEDGCDAPFSYPIESGTAWKSLAPIDELIEKACAALGWDNLTVKGDFVVHDNDFYIIELAPRLSGGFFSSHTIPWAYSVDMVQSAIELALGERVSALGNLSRHPSCVSQRYIFPGKNNIGKTVVSFGGEFNDSAFYTWSVRVGDTIRPVTSHPNRLGQAIATGGTPEEARSKAESAVEMMWQNVVLR